MRIKILGVATIAALAVAGCGSTPSSSGSPSAATTSSAVAPPAGGGDFCHSFLAAYRAQNIKAQAAGSAAKVDGTQEWVDTLTSLEGSATPDQKKGLETMIASANAIKDNGGTPDQAKALAAVRALGAIGQSCMAH